MKNLTGDDKQKFFNTLKDNGGKRFSFYLICKNYPSLMLELIIFSLKHQITIDAAQIMREMLAAAKDVACEEDGDLAVILQCVEKINQNFDIS